MEMSVTNKIKEALSTGRHIVVVGEGAKCGVTSILESICKIATELKDSNLIETYCPESRLLHDGVGHQTTIDKLCESDADIVIVDNLNLFNTLRCGDLEPLKMASMREDRTMVLGIKTRKLYGNEPVKCVSKEKRLTEILCVLDMGTVLNGKDVLLIDVCRESTTGSVSMTTYDIEIDIKLKSDFVGVTEDGVSLDRTQTEARGHREIYTGDKSDLREPKFVMHGEVEDIEMHVGNMHVVEIEKENFGELEKLMVCGHQMVRCKMKIVLATSNMNKIREFREMMTEPLTYQGEELEIVSMKDMGITEDIPENGKSYEVNALIKATHVFNKLGGEHIVIAEDSGFSVECLGMKPGVESARFMSDVSSDERNQYIVNQLNGKTGAERNCHYIAHMVALLPLFKHSVLNASAICHGYVSEELKGTNGFAYDNIFMSTDYGNHTMAELTNEQKNVISHRGNALRIMLEKLTTALKV